MSFEHLQPDSAQEIQPIIIGGKAAEAIRQVAGKYDMDPRDVAIGFIAVGKTALDDLESGRRVGSQLRKHGLGEYDFVTSCVENPELKPFAAAQLHNR